MRTGLTTSGKTLRSVAAAVHHADHKSSAVRRAFLPTLGAARGPRPQSSPTTATRQQHARALFLPPLDAELPVRPQTSPKPRTWATEMFLVPESDKAKVVKFALPAAVGTAASGPSQRRRRRPQTPRPGAEDLPPECGSTKAAAAVAVAVTAAVPQAASSSSSSASGRPRLRRRVQSHSCPSIPEGGDTRPNASGATVLAPPTKSMMLDTVAASLHAEATAANRRAQRPHQCVTTAAADRAHKGQLRLNLELAEKMWSEEKPSQLEGRGAPPKYLAGTATFSEHVWSPVVGRAPGLKSGCGPPRGWQPPLVMGARR